MFPNSQTSLEHNHSDEQTIYSHQPAPYYDAKASPTLSAYSTPDEIASRSPTVESPDNQAHLSETPGRSLGHISHSRFSSFASTQSFYSASSYDLCSKYHLKMAEQSSGTHTHELIARVMPEKRVYAPRKRSSSMDIPTDSARLLRDDQVSSGTHESGGFDMSDDDAPSYASGSKRPRKEPPAYQTWALDEFWIYFAFGEQIDHQYLLPGVKPFARPSGWLPESGEMSARSLYPQAAPFLAKEKVPGRMPQFKYDPLWNRVIITPHREPLRDLRELAEHPDWLPKEKLVEYQSVEIAGWPIWRHDRNQLPCCKSGCKVNTVDQDVRTQICLGCGPCSETRYCSKSHMEADLKDHWEECGSLDNLIPHFIDHGTRPARFSRRYPSIFDVNEVNSFERHRQQYYYFHNKGQYTVFLSKQDPFVVIWPTPQLQQLYGPRVERLMNVAFFDQSRENVVGCLFYHIRMALRLAGKWTDEVAAVLKMQFDKEFGWNTDGAYPEDLCECVWLGDEADERLCTAACAHASMVAGGVRKGPGLKGLLEALESKHFLLRIWQRQHSSTRDWRKRLEGEGFPGARLRDLSKERPLFGKGWDGIGAPHTFGGWEAIF